MSIHYLIYETLTALLGALIALYFGWMAIIIVSIVLLLLLIIIDALVSRPR